MNQLTGVTFQVRVSNFEEGQKWYETLFNRKADFIPHGNFAEWEVIPNTWLQVSEGVPSIGNGPLRIGVENIKEERLRLMEKLNCTIEEVNTREGVPAAWCTFEDPDGNLIGLFEDLAKTS
ncbi:VOC family protein [Pseudalkalibacillus berkeleyi]|uniref:VOC family protein n=1 Tax=Pseudalkalibacillus berkeleyi TaxID=1069813 RepID=A0ABS9GU91_9BACL|nr:VOC family protein [Pseudalkalibacillus berkeleyi]MCF6136412.1 VOC family protein [Pseudalkalibacillus berkeleyi]